jgi:small neutral amino acid transporter SnatA (MarC family)
MAELAEHNPEQRKRIIVTALVSGAIALAFFTSAFFFFRM